MDHTKKLLDLCKSKNETISSCESLTAGLFSSTLASVPGASSVLKGGFVTYFTEMKEVLVHVSSTTISEFGVVSTECAVEMAENTRNLTNSTYAVSFTGNAGPACMDNKPAGRVYCAIASDICVRSYCFQVDGLDRNAVREYVVDKMIDNLIEFIDKE